MIVKYKGLTPITNVLGDWQPGETKTIDGNNHQGIKLTELDNFEIILSHNGIKSKTTKKTTKKPMTEKLSDKMDRDNIKVEEN